MNVPKLRFGEFFANKWNNKQLVNICDMRAGKFVRASEINGDFDEGLYPCYGGNGLRGFTKSFTHEGKHSLIGRQGALCGNVTLAINKFHATEHAVVVSASEGVSTDWLFYALGRLNLNQYATGQAQPGLSVENLEKVELSISDSEKEQQKIADFLSAVDEKITALTAQKTALTHYKQGMMQRIFAQTLRFKDDNGADYPEWEDLNIKEMLTIGSGRDYKHLNHGEVPVFGTGGYMLSVNDYLDDGETVFIGRKGTINKPAYYQGKFWTVDTLFYTHSFKAIPKFVFYLFETIDWLSYNEATGVPSLSKSTIEKIKVSLPNSVEEQTKIAQFLTECDDKINAVDAQIQSAQQWKQGLLQQMFV